MDTKTYLSNLMPSKWDAQFLLVVPCLFGLHLACLAIYRIWLSPIAKVPGPRLAALTYWYEIYYDVFQRGRFLWKIQELHEKYGPIVRINPTEVHIKDVEFYDKIYTSGSSHARNKVRFMALRTDSMFDTFDAALHRKRRAAISNPFSKRAIRSLQPAIVDIINEVAGQRLHDAARDGAVVEIHALWNSMTQEVIGQYCFGTSDMKGLRSGRDDAQFLGTFDEVPGSNARGRHFPILFNLVGSLPLPLLARLMPKFDNLAKFDARIHRQVEDVMATETPLIGAKNVFHEMRDSKHLPENDKNPDYYQREAVSFIGGGTETTASSLSTISFWLAARPEITAKLRQELDAVLPGDGSMPPLETLEALPYLTGVVKEGIRLSVGVPGRLPRYAPSENLQYGPYKLPAGTIMSSSSFLYHFDEELFPDPFVFSPERWVKNPIEMQRNFFAFGRGARSCIGINLAHAEIYLAVAAIFSRFDLMPYETTARDVELVGDDFIGLRPADSKGVRVTVKTRSE